jgi:hypothetical protein
MGVLLLMLKSRKITKLMDSRVDVMMLAVTLNSDYIGRDYWRDTEEYKRMLKAGSFKGSSLVLVGASHTLTDIRQLYCQISLSSDFLGHELKKYLLPNPKKVNKKTISNVNI